MPYPLHSQPLAFLGCGSMAQSLIQGYLNSSALPKENLFISGRNPKKSRRIAEKFQIQNSEQNEELLEKSSIIFICVKPQDLEGAVQALSGSWQKNHTVISLVAGKNFKQLQKLGLPTQRLVRLMPNTAVSTGQGILPFCSLNGQESLYSFIKELLKPLGKAFVLQKEEDLNPLTVASSSGLAFVLELMQYWMEWLTEKNFSPEKARELVIQIFSGAGIMSEKRGNKSFSDLQKEISSQKGITQEGLKEMRELELERILRLSFEKALLKIKEIEQED